MILHFETEDEYNQMIPVPIERYEHLLMVESIFDKAIDELTTDIEFDRKTYYFRHQILMMLGQASEALKMQRKEKEFEDNLGRAVTEKLQRM